MGAEIEEDWFFKDVLEFLYDKGEHLGDWVEHAKQIFTTFDRSHAFVYPFKDKYLLSGRYVMTHTVILSISTSIP